MQMYKYNDKIEKNIIIYIIIYILYIDISYIRIYTHLIRLVPSKCNTASSACLQSRPPRYSVFFPGAERHEASYQHFRCHEGWGELKGQWKTLAKWHWCGNFMKFPLYIFNICWLLYDGYCQEIRPGRSPALAPTVQPAVLSSVAGTRNRPGPSRAGVSTFVVCH